jgi:glutathione S-transferase
MTNQPPIKLFGCPNSRSMRAAWALEEAGAAYDYVKLDLRQGEGRSAEYLAVNPGGKVPALVDGTLIISESAAIVTYIGERFPDSGLVPPLSQPGQRAAYFEWSYFILSELEQPLWTIAKHRFALPPDWRVPAIEATAAKEFQRAIDVAATRLGNREFTVGSRFSAADILLAHTIAWAKSAQVAFAAPALETFFARHWARPARLAADARERLSTPAQSDDTAKPG